MQILLLVAERLGVETKCSIVHLAHMQRYTSSTIHISHCLLCSPHELGRIPTIAVRSKDSQGCDLAVAVTQFLVQASQHVAYDLSVIFCDMEESWPSENVVYIEIQSVILRQANSVDILNI